MSVLVFDTETTDRQDGEIIEAAWLQLVPDPDLVGGSDRIPMPLFVEQGYCARFRPEKPSTFGAMAVHHILPSELQYCPPSNTFRLPNEASYIIGHSIDFDWQAAGSPAHIKRICTHAMAQHVWPDASGYSQSALLYMLLGATDATRDLLRGAHSAMIDVGLNLTLLGFILKERPAIETWAQLWAFSEECRIPRTCPMKRYAGVLLEDLDDGFIRWCLNQDWLDPYFRIGLQRVMKKRYAGANVWDGDDEEEEEP